MSKAINILSGLRDWIDDRFPLMKIWNEHLAQYYAPKNFNFWYFFGAFAILVLGIQVLTGIWLTMNYKPSAEEAFASVEYIMRDTEWGWLIRYMHSTGASAFFIVIYLHMFRALLYGSYKKPRELLWLSGMALYLLLMGEAFFGYLLPWGQMSYWGAQVIISLFGALPIIGDDLSLWIRGDFVVSDVTLNRFFSLHVIAFPLLILGLVGFHILALHEVGSNNPDGIEIKKNKNEKGVPLDGIPFHPYYTVKDLMGAVVFLIFFFAVVFFAPEMKVPGTQGLFLESANFIQANPPNFDELIKNPLAVNLFLLLPWLDRSPVKSIRYRGRNYRIALSLFVISFLFLGWLGLQVVTPVYTWMARFFSVVYFSFFFLMPFYTASDKDKTVPDRVTT